MRHSETRPERGLYERLGREHDNALRQVQTIAVDRQTHRARKHIQRDMRAAQLKGLANAVGSTSSLMKQRRVGRTAWGAVFAKGGDESLAGGALHIYSTGGTIRPTKGKWLWIATPAVGRRMGVGGGAGRFRITPALYRAAGSPLGPLKFRRVRSNLAQYYAKKLIVSPKTGRARVPGKRPRSAVEDKVVLFWGIKLTRRAKRFDPERVVGLYAGQLPEEIGRELERFLRAMGLQ